MIATVLLVVVTIVVGGLAFVALRTRARVRRLETTVCRLEELVRDELEPGVAAARADARAAGAAARDAAVGVGVAPPRLPFEPVTGHVVRAVAFGASAQRVLARVTTLPWSPRREHRRSA